MHVLITREELLWREADHEHDALEWDEIASIEWAVPRSKVGLVRVEDALHTLVSGALAAFNIGGLEPRLPSVRVTTTAGDELEWTTTPHHAIGYPAADVRVIAPFLRQLRESPTMRAQLATDPRATLAELARQRG